MVHTHTTTGVRRPYGRTKIEASTVVWDAMPANGFLENDPITWYELCVVVYSSLYTRLVDPQVVRAMCSDCLSLLILYVDGLSNRLKLRGL